VTRATTPAVGGSRAVPVPDPVARDYLLLALRLDQHVPGLVDGYYGPADLKARVDMESIRPPERLADDAAELRDRLANEIHEPQRRAWLAAQLLALETQAAALAGDSLPYVEHVTRCFGWSPLRRDESDFAAAGAEIERRLPGTGSLTARLDAFDDQFTVDPARVPEVVEWLVGRYRDRARILFGLPEGEDLRVGLVRNQPWTGYNWYDGGLRSRVDINLDLPLRAHTLLHVAAHETYPGHHLEHAWKEAELVERLGRLEASILLINTPECLISEGLADLGVRFADPPDEAIDIRLELFERARLAIAADPAAAREAAALQVALAVPRRVLAQTRVNAALLRHADGWDHDAVLAWLREHGRLTEAVAAKQIEFIEHPLWRTYVFVYHEGEALLGRWLDAVPAGDQAARFGRLLREQLTPAAVAAEIPR
jgi:hypothetical protein